MKYLLLVLCLVLAGCDASVAPSTNIPEIPHNQKILEEEGYVNIKLGGAPIFGCSEHDSWLTSNKFTAEKNGHKVDGYVCCGLFLKGCTIRR